MADVRPVAARRPSFRLADQHRTEGDAKRSRAVGLLVWGLALLIFCVWLIYQLIPQRTATVVVTGVVRYDRECELTPIPWQDVAWQAESDDPAAEASRIRWVPLPEAVMRGQELLRLTDQLTGVDQLGPRDMLVVILSGYVTTEDDVPYLLSADYSVQENRLQRVAVADVLAAVARAKPGPKLVVLDVHPLTFDPRTECRDLAVSQHLAAAVRDLDGASPREPLWILVPSRPGEIPQVSFSERDTLFGGAVRDGLAGYADLPSCMGNDDYRVSLGELYRYTAVRCRARSDNEQTPLLLRYGRGVVVPGADEDGTMVSARPRELGRPPEAAAESAASTVDPGNSVRQGVGVVQGGADRAASDLGRAAAESAASQTADAPAAADGAATPPTAQQPELAAEATAAAPAEAAPAGATRSDTSPPPDAAADLDEPFPTLWQMHDAMAGTADPTDPEVRILDFAPQYWRWLEAQLLDWDLRQHWGAQSGRVTSTSPESLLAEFKALRGDPDADATVLAATRSLTESAAHYRQAIAAATDPSVLRAESAVRVYMRLVYRARDFLLWHARWSLASRSGSSPQRDRLLADFIQDLDTFAAALPPLMRTQELAVAELTSLVADLERQLGSPTTPSSLLGKYRLLLESVEDDVQRVGSDQAIFYCLLSPLLTESQRRQLYRRLRADESRSPEDLGSATEQQWAAVEESVGQPARRTDNPMAHWYGRLLAFCAGGEGLERASRLATDPSGWAEAHQQLLQELDQVETPGTLADDKSLGRAIVLRLSDHRDLRRGRFDSRPAAFVRLRPVYPDVVDVTIDPTDQLAVRPPGTENAAMITIMFRSTDPHRRDIGWKLEFDEQELIVTRSGETKRLASGEQSRLPVTESLAQVQLLIEPRQPAAREPRVTDLAISTLDGERPTSHRLTCRLPRDEIVEIGADPLIVGLDGSWTPLSPTRYETPLDPRDNAVLRLEPFPNRDTRYSLRIRNRSETPKQLRVQLLAVRLRPDSPRRWPLGRLSDGRQVFREVWNSVWSADQELRTDLQILGEAELSLAADEEQALVLQPPGGATGPADAPASPAPTAPPPEPTSVVDGLVAVVTGSRPNERWLKWIEIIPAHPQNFVTVQEARLDRERLSVTLMPAAAAALLPGIRASLDQQPGQFLPLGEPLVLPYTADEPEKTLAIEGVPRAVVLRPAAADRTTWRDQRRDLRRVALQGLAGQTDQGLHLAYVAAGFENAWQPPAAADSAPVSPPRRITGATPVFPRLQSLRMDLAVDAPLNAFVPGSQDDPPLEYVRVTLARTDDARVIAERVFFEDRLWDARGKVSDGQLSVGINAVQDLFLAVPAEGATFPPESGEYSLESWLHVNGYAPLSTETPVRIMVDTEPPQRVNFQGLPPSVPEGRERLVVQLTCRDLTGPTKVAYAFVPKPSDPLPAEALVKTLSPVKQLRDEWTAELELLIADLKTAPTNKVNTYYFKAMVWDEAENATAFPPADTEPPALRVTPPPAPPTKGELVVLVRWRRNNDAIAGANVTVTGPSGQKLTRTTDAAGRASFPNLDFGTYGIEAAQGRYKDAQTVELKDTRSQVTLFPSSL